MSVRAKSMVERGCDFEANVKTPINKRRRGAERLEAECV